MTGSVHAQPPHSIEAEQSVLGAVLIDPAAWPAVSHLTAEDFYRTGHRAIYAALAAFAEESAAIDAVTVAEQLDRAGELDAVGGLAYLSELAENTPTAANAGTYAGFVREHADRRRMIALAGELAESATNAAGNETVRALADRFMGELAELAEHAGGEPARRALAVPAVQGNFPEPVLSAAGRGGAVLTVGSVAVLAGEGGIAKSALAVSIALDLAMHAAGEGAVRSGLFDAPKGGPVLLATYEDEPAVTAWRARKLADKHKADAAALQRVHVLDMASRHLFGPAPDGGTYNARPVRLAGWWDLWREASRIGPRLVIVDPALSAYVGEQNAAAPVREFLAALTGEAKAHGCGVLLVAHSNKAARGGKSGNDRADPFDPGQVSGSTAWTDGVRGALSMTWAKDGNAKPGDRVLAIGKANYGPARIKVDLDPIRARPFGGGEGKGAIVGFKARGEWGDEKATAASASSPASDDWNDAELP